MRQMAQNEIATDLFDECARLRDELEAALERAEKAETIAKDFARSHQELDECAQLPTHPLASSPRPSIARGRVMKLLTCSGCKFAGDCDHARHMRKSLKGYGIRSLQFACAKRENLFAPGQAVTFTTYAPADDEYNNAVPVTYRSYVIEQIGTRVFGFIAKGTLDVSGYHSFEPRGNGYVKIPMSRVHADETRGPADVRQCEWCANHPGVGAPCGFHQYYTPKGECLAKEIAEPAPPAQGGE